MSGLPQWFGPEARPLFGWVHVPPGGRTRGAVVLCHPLGREHDAAHGAFRRLAEELASVGLSVVRFDYDGTGDSAGGDDDPERVRSWSASIDHAVRLGKVIGGGPVALVGMRMGALLATITAASGQLGPIAGLVLWDPCTSGRTFLREQRALQLLASRGARPRNDGETEIPGFVFSAATSCALRDLRMPLDRPAPAPDVLVLRRPDGGSAGQPGTTWWEGAELGDAVGQPELFEAPLDRRMPVETIERITSWLDERMPSTRALVTPTGRRTTAVVGHVGASPIRERIVSLGPNGLFGIATDPPGIGHEGSQRDSREGPGGRRPPHILLLNSGNDTHIGPSRQWVRFARLWAGLGLESVRLDLSGLGDSPVRPGQRERVIRAPEAFDDVLDAARAVSPDDPSNVVLVGLCSGAYQALESAFTLVPRGVCAVNPLLRFDPPELSYGPLDERRRICRPRSPFVRHYRRLGLARLGGPARALGRRLSNIGAGRAAPARWLGELVTAGVDIWCLCGDDEARQLLQGTRRALSRLVSSGRLSIAVHPGLDHALLPADQQDQACDMLTEHLRTRFAPRSSTAPGRLAGPQASSSAIGEQVNHGEQREARSVTADGRVVRMEGLGEDGPGWAPPGPTVEGVAGLAEEAAWHDMSPPQGAECR